MNCETLTDHKTPQCQIHIGDCRELLPAIAAVERPRFIFADPPFNIGHPYAEHDDRISPDLHEQATREWIDAALASLAPGGVLAVHLPDKDAALVAYEYRDRRAAWLVWHYRFGQCHRGNWINSKAHCLIHSAGGHTWNPSAVLVDSDRKSTYADPRIHETDRGGQRVPFDVWGIPSDGNFWGRVQGNNKERWCRKTGALVDHPNQLPEVYLQRLILAYTDVGDLVCDPFVGSGTTPVVARALGRRFVGCEKGRLTARSAWKRIERGPVRVVPIEEPQLAAVAG